MYHVPTYLYHPGLAYKYLCAVTVTVTVTHARVTTHPRLTPPDVVKEFHRLVRLESTNHRVSVRLCGAHTIL